MKKIFTFASAALVAAAAVAAPKASMLKAEMTPEAQQKFASHIAMIQNKDLASIDGEIIGKRTCQVGNLIWDMYAIRTGKVVDNITFTGENGEEVKATFDEFPLYAVEYCIEATNATTGAGVSMIASMLFWPSEYYRQCFTWEGPWSETTGSNGKVYYDIPVEYRNYEIVPFEDLVGENSVLAAPFKFTGYVAPFAYPNPENEKQYVQIENYQMLNYGGLSYNNRDISITTDFDPKTMGGNAVPTVTFQEYDSSDEYMLIDNKYYFAYVTLDANGNVTGTNGNGQMTLTYDGEGFTKGFGPRTYDIDLVTFHLFNAGLFDEDNNAFYEYTADEEPLQQYFIKFGNDQIQGIGVGGGNDRDQILEEIEEDPSFQNVIADNDYYKFLVGEGFDENQCYYGQGYLFSAAESQPTNCQWDIKYAEEHTYGGGRKVYDYLIPEAGMFVSYNEFSSVSPRVRSAWAKTYGLQVIQRGKYLLEPENEGAYIANNTPDGLIIRFRDDADNVVNLHASNYVYHSNAEDVRDEQEMSAVGTFTPDVAVKSIFGSKGGVKVAARNGMISIESMEAGNVAVYTMDGALVNAAKTNGVATLNIPAAKGMYIVKVGNETRKVVL